MFDQLTERLSTALKVLSGRGHLSDDNIADTLRQVRLALLEADVALPVVKTFTDAVRARALGIEVTKSLTPGQAFIKVVHEELTRLMGEPSKGLNLRAQRPVVVMLAGLQGAGKTTTAGKIARWLIEKQRMKVLLVVRQEADGIRRYCHFGTGNYNPKTATSYEDLGVLSSDPDLGSDLSELFNHLTGYSRPGEYRRLLVAPMHLRDELRDLIRGQAQPDGEITMKINALVDSEMIDELYAASEAGAKIDLVVRSICCLRAGVPGLSENITVRSVVGRYLEHSRIIRFGKAGDPDTEYVIGSADLMPRNLDRRVEAMLRITDARMRARLDEILTINFADDVLAWTLERDGTWHKVETVAGVESQVRFQELAVARAKVRTPDG